MARRIAENTSVGPKIMDSATAPSGLNAVSPRRLPYFTTRDTAPEMVGIFNLLSPQRTRVGMDRSPTESFTKQRGVFLAECIAVALSELTCQ